MPIDSARFLEELRRVNPINGIESGFWGGSDGGARALAMESNKWN